MSPPLHTSTLSSATPHLQPHVLINYCRDLQRKICIWREGEGTTTASDIHPSDIINDQQLCDIAQDLPKNGAFIQKYIPISQGSSSTDIAE